MARQLSRRKKTALWVAGGGIALGLGAVFLLPIIRRRFQSPTITIPAGEITVTPSTQAAINSAVTYDPSQPINEDALTFLTPEQRTSLEWST